MYAVKNHVMFHILQVITARVHAYSCGNICYIKRE